MTTPCVLLLLVVVWVLLGCAEGLPSAPTGCTPLYSVWKSAGNHAWGYVDPTPTLYFANLSSTREVSEDVAERYRAELDRAGQVDGNHRAGAIGRLHPTLSGAFDLFRLFAARYHEHIVGNDHQCHALRPVLPFLKAGRSPANNGESGVPAGRCTNKEKECDGLLWDHEYPLPSATCDPFRLLHIEEFAPAIARDGRRATPFRWPDGSVRPIYAGHVSRLTTLARRKGRDMTLHASFHTAPTMFGTMAHPRKGGKEKFTSAMTALFPAYAVPSPGVFGVKPGEKRTLSFLCYNVWNFNGNWAIRASAIGRLVKKHRPDAVAWQELRYDSKHGHNSGSASRQYSGHQIEHLVRHVRNKIPYWFVYQPAMTYFEQMATGFAVQFEGPAFFFKHSVIHVEHRLLTRYTHQYPDDEHQRAVLCVVLHVPEIGRVDLFTTHYSLSDIPQRSNARETVAFVNEIAGKSFGNPKITPPSVGGRPVVSLVMGDLNTTPETKTMDVFREAGFVDMWVALNGNTSEAEHKGFTFNNLNAPHLGKRIDFMLVKTPPPVPGRPKVTLKSMELLNYGNDASFVEPPSDHVALLGKIEIEHT